MRSWGRIRAWLSRAGSEPASAGMPAPPAKFAKRVLLVIGPESSATRTFTRLLSQHPWILGTPDAPRHADVLDEVWEQLAAGRTQEAAAALPEQGAAPCLLTRRSLPHGAPGTDARFQDFADLDRFRDFLLERDLELVVLVTSRSPAANLASWTLERASVGGSLERAARQYLAAYRHLFAFLARSQTPFLLLSLEALLLDRAAYLQSIFQLLGLPPHPGLALDLKPRPNADRYAWFAAQEHDELLR